MGLMQKVLRRRAERLEDQYWQGVRGYGYTDILEERVDFAVIDMPGSPWSGLVFLTNRQLIVAVWEPTRVARPLAAIPLQDIEGAQLDGRYVGLTLCGDSADRAGKTAMGVQFAASYPEALAHRWWQNFRSVWELYA